MLPGLDNLLAIRSAFEQIGGQNMNSELYPPLVGRSIYDRLILDAIQYLFAPVKNSDPEV